VACPTSKCDGLFATALVKANLSEFEQLEIEEREAQRNTNVALATGDVKAVLRCLCGSVGVVTAKDVGDGQVVCPGNIYI
jgi:hypothetical protein